LFCKHLRSRVVRAPYEAQDDFGPAIRTDGAHRL